MTIPAFADDAARTVVDDRGVSVPVPAAPKRIASVSFFGADVALALGIKPVAVTYMEPGHAPDFLLGLTGEATQIGQRAKANLELLFETHPDLIVAIKRYTVGNAAAILLLDEPTSFLDLGYQVEVLDLLHRLSRERDVAVVIAIHDLNQALAACDHVSLLESGRPVFQGEPEALAASGLIETVFRVRGRFVRIAPQAPPHFDVDLVHRAARA